MMSDVIVSYPQSWRVIPLGEFVDSEKGKKPKSQKDTSDKEYIYPYVDIEAFEEGNIKSWTNGEGCRLCSEEDFLMVWDGSRSGLVGKGMNGALGSTLVRINFPEIENNYAYYFLQSKYLEINTRAKGSGTPHVDPALLWNYELPIAPLNEQKRIVAKMEELFSELDKGIESFKTTQEQLKVYRQAVLKHAFDGNLTADWREKNKDKLENAEELFVRIEKEREAHYQQQLEEWNSAIKAWAETGRDGKKPTKPNQPTKLIPITSDNLPNIPAGWIWAKYGDLCSLIRNGISKKPEGDVGTKIFRISAVRPMEFDLEDIRYINNSSGEFNDYYLKAGDLVFTRYNGSRAYVGVCAEYKSDGSHLYPDKLIRTQLGTFSTLPGYIEKAVNSGASRHFLEKRIRTTAGQSGISGSDIKNIPVPVCEPKEQKLIQERVDAKLSNISQLLADIDQNLARSEALRQSILKKAFLGQLVEQDPNDEPASALLERIKGEKAENEKTNKKNKRKKAA